MLRRNKVLRRAVSLLQLVVCLLVFLFLALPFLFRFSPWLQTNMVFLPHVRMPTNLDLRNPSSLGMSATHNLYLSSQSGVTVGVWHMLPGSHDPDAHPLPDQLGPDQPVVLYLHGNTGHRASPARLELYQVLRGLDYHVVTLDYRGFADSSSVAHSVTGVVADARAVYDWVGSKSEQKTQVIVWGHSLGAGVAAHLVADLCTQGTRPNGLVLESPFNNIYDEIRNHRLTWPWRKLPGFDWFFTTPLSENDLGFISDQKMSEIDVPILILHAEDDEVIPLHLGQSLHQTALSAEKEGKHRVEFKQFDRGRGFGHSHICRAPELPGIVEVFVRKCQENVEADDSLGEG